MTKNTITLNNGVEMPAIGLGVFQSPPMETGAAVEAAIRSGYRHIDTAAAYGNERDVGEGIRRSGIARDDIFIETKIWISDYGYDETLHGFEKAVAKLGVERLDLLLLHQPLPTDFDRTLAAYRALETLLDRDLVRAIGVSNFMPGHLERLLDAARIVPAVNQIEVHPFFQRADYQQLMGEHGVQIEAWGPFAEGRNGLFTNAELAAIGAAHGKSVAQVVLRWLLQQGFVALSKTARPERLAENAALFDFELPPEDMAAISALARPDGRIVNPAGLAPDWTL